jgi:serine/threonine-protein kinase
VAKIGPYELVAQLASGNTGYVYSARPPDGGLIALKLIKPRLAKEQRYSQLLFTEAPQAINFLHPNATRILEIDRAEDDLFIAMEIVEGKTLAHILDRSIADRRPLSPELLFWIASSTASALRAAHETPWAADETRGMYHGEVSPQSVLITWDGTVKLVGAGIGRSRVTLPPARARLPYRAPELFSRNAVDGGNDIYGLGVVLYEGLTKRSPFARDQVADTRQAILDNVFIPLVIERPDLAPGVDELIGRMMAREPQDRPDNMAVVEDALHNFLEQDDDILRSLLAEEMRVLFVEELSESGLSQPRAAPDPWGKDRSPFQKMSAPARPSLTTPPPQVLSESNPIVPIESPPPPQRTLSKTGIYDEFEVDQLVDAIVAASSAAKPRLETPPPAEPIDFAPMHPPPSSSPSVFAKALDEQGSEFEIDQLVDAIVHASAKARQPPPRGGSQARKDAFVVKEAIHAGAVGDVALEPRRKQPSSRAIETGRRPAGDNDDFSSIAAVLLEPGDLVGNRYRVIDNLGQGGMSVVYKVEHVHLQKLLALKLLRPELSQIPYVVQRFQREARCVSQLDDPHIVRVTDFGRADNGSLYLVMELIEGQSLTDRLTEGAPLQVEDAMSIMEQILAGLEHAHRNNVIHRDLKPDNIMLVAKDGMLLVKIVDFGIAKLVNDESLETKPVTQAGMVFGSPRYMSPEQANGEAVDSRADLYAAAIICYEMLTGRRPFDGQTVNAVFSKLLTQDPPPMNLKTPSANAGKRLEHVIARALSKEIDERYPTAGTLWEALLVASSG